MDEAWVVAKAIGGGIVHLCFVLTVGWVLFLLFWRIVGSPDIRFSIKKEVPIPPEPLKPKPETWNPKEYQEALAEHEKAVARIQQEDREKMEHPPQARNRK